MVEFIIGILGLVALYWFAEPSQSIVPRRHMRPVHFRKVK